MTHAIHALLTQLQGLPAQQAEQRNVIRMELRQEVTNTIQMMVKANNNRVSKELLTFMDGLYDIAGMPTLFADALVIDLHDVRRMLGRKRQVVCKQCKKPFEVFEARKKGGYESAHAEYCLGCYELKKEEWAVHWAEQSTQEQKRYTLYARILSRSPYDVAQLPEFKEAVSEYAKYWITGKSETWLRQRRSHGCMLCDKLPVGIFLTQDDSINHKHQKLLSSVEYEEENTRQMSGRDYEPSWTILERPFQFLIRMNPYWYFEALEDTPLLQQVILFLCEKHSEIAEETHFRPYGEWINAE